MRKLLKKFTPKFIISAYHYSLASFGALYYHFPSRKIKVIGITGTKGKSSTLFLTAKIFEAAGHKVNWVSSLTIKQRDREFLNPFHMTMPGRFFIQKALSKAVKFGCDYFLIEVTSEGVKQHRHRFIDFDTAVFTNLAPEHIEAHGSFENYKKAKSQLFRNLEKSFVKTLKGEKIPKTIIANVDDENCAYFLNFWADQKIGFGLNPLANCLRACNLAIIPSSERQLFISPLLGKFNFYNNLAAYTIAISQKIDKELIKSVLAKIKLIPGRMEEIKEGQKFQVVVDLAHTPESFEQVFETVNLIKRPSSKIIVVFGSAGGGRDRWKRPELGRLAAQYADFIVLTNEDPYNENPKNIINEITTGIKNSKFLSDRLLKIEDRRLGIRKGLELAKISDIVLILGKGTESTYIVGDTKYPWDDRRVVSEELKNILKESQRSST